MIYIYIKIYGVINHMYPLHLTRNLYNLGGRFMVFHNLMLTLN